MSTGEPQRDNNTGSLSCAVDVKAHTHLIISQDRFIRVHTAKPELDSTAFAVVFFKSFRSWLHDCLFTGTACESPAQLFSLQHPVAALRGATISCTVDTIYMPEILAQNPAANYPLLLLPLRYTRAEWNASNRENRSNRWN